MELDDLPDARQRVSHFVADCNFFCPHRGIGGRVPADRHFGTEAALRRTHESQLADDGLALAVSAVPRTRSYLFGQIRDEQVGVHGVRGELVVQTSSGLRQEIGLDDLGASRAAQGANGDANSDRSDSGGVERPGDTPMQRRRTGKHGLVFVVPEKMSPGVKEQWRASGSEAQARAHRSCVEILAMWPGTKPREEVARSLGVPPLRVWQLSQQAVAGILAGLLKQPRTRSTGAEASGARGKTVLAS